MKLHPINKVLIWIAFILFGWLFFNALDLIRRGRVEIMPDPESIQVLHFTEHHWFSKNEYIRLEARPDQDNPGQMVWMAKSPKTGEWYKFFREPVD